jgi:glycosidase
MKKIIIALAAVALAACSGPAFDPATVADASAEQVTRVEPLSWWTGMKMPLQLLVQGENISEYDVTIEGGKGVSVVKINKADSPNYVFVDVKIAANAQPGTYYIVFSKDGQSFKYPYEIAAREAGSAERTSFTTADMIYLIMPDRFANGDTTNDSTDDTDDKYARNELFGRHGGDIQGIIDHLDYISDLGATAIWCTPLLEDNQPEHSYHGYACTDYYHIDSRFGTNDLFKEYVNKAHEKGIKIIMDIVPNHAGSAHWWMKDTPFKDWYHVFDTYTGSNIAFSTNMDPNASKKDLYIQESGWFDRSMVDMNLDNPYVLRYFQQWAIWWVEWSGLDGFRVDTYPYNEKDPMSEWCAAVMNEYPNFNIVGEVWTSSIPQLAYWQGDNANKDGFNSNLKSIMDFPLHDAMRAAMTEAGSNVAWGQGMTRVYDVLSHDFVYHDLSNMMIMAANHDTDRIGDVCEGDSRKMKIVHTLLATLRGMPQILYGDELMFRSTDRSKGHPTLRVDFPGGWDGDAQNLFDKVQHSGAQKDVYDYTRAIMNWRKTKDVIHSGKTMHFIDRDNTYAYFRYDDNDVVFVYINNTDSVREIPWARYAEIAEGLTEGRDVITGEIVTMSGAKVAPMSTLVVEFQR